MVNVNAGSSRTLAEWFEDFISYQSNIPEDYGLRETKQAAAASIAHRADAGGWIRLAMSGDDTDSAMVGGVVIWEPDEGIPLIFAARLRTSDASKSSIFVGLSDANTETNGVVIENESGSLNTVPADAVGFLLEGEQSLNWQAVAVKNNADSALVKLGGDSHEAEDGEPVLLQLEVHQDGSVRFYINGGFMHEMKEAIRTSRKYAPVISADDRATAYNVDIDSMFMCQPRKLA